MTVNGYVCAAAALFIVQTESKDNEGCLASFFSVSYPVVIQ